MRVSEGGALPDQARALFPQIPSPPLVVRHDPSDSVPVIATVSSVSQVYQFVDDYVIDEAYRGCSFDQFSATAPRC